MDAISMKFILKIWNSYKFSLQNSQYNIEHVWIMVLAKKIEKKTPNSLAKYTCLYLIYVHKINHNFFLHDRMKNFRRSVHLTPNQL